MGALRLTLRADLRRRWRLMLMLALLLGITASCLAASSAWIRPSTRC